jgi:hypothetical protein
MRSAAACVAGVGGLLLACSRPTPVEPPLDATAQKLKALAEAPPPRPRPVEEDPHARLTERATREDATAPRSLPLPHPNPTAWAGGVALKLTKLSTEQRISGGKLQLVTDETFLLVTLLAQNVGQGVAEMDLATARLALPTGAEVSPTPDVQRLVGTVPSLRSLAPGGEEVRQEWVLAFEVPDKTLVPGLTLKVGGASLPLR